MASIAAGHATFRLLSPGRESHAPGMFVVSEAEAAAIRTAFEQRGELSAAVELRRRFPGIIDNAQAGSARASSLAGSRCRCARLGGRKPPRHLTFYVG